MSDSYRVMRIGEAYIWELDWNDGFLGAGETLTGNSWEYGPTTGAGLTLANQANTTTKSSVKVTANARGHYVVTGTVTTNASPAQTGKRSIEIRVTDSP